MLPFKLELMGYNPGVKNRQLEVERSEKGVVKILKGCVNFWLMCTKHMVGSYSQVTHFKGGVFKVKQMGHVQTP